MSRASSLPVAATKPDKDGLPTRLSVPGLTKKATPIVLSGKRIGQVAPDGSVAWAPAGAVGGFRDYIAHADALDQAARARKRLRASVIDGKVAAIVVPAKRNTTNRRKN